LFYLGEEGVCARQRERRRHLVEVGDGAEQSCGPQHPQLLVLAERRERDERPQRVADVVQPLLAGLRVHVLHHRREVVAGELVPRPVPVRRVAGGQRGVAAAVHGATGVGDPHVVSAVRQDVAQRLVRGVHQPRHAVLNDAVQVAKINQLHLLHYVLKCMSRFTLMRAVYHEEAVLEQHRDLSAGRRRLAGAAAAGDPLQAQDVPVRGGHLRIYSRNSICVLHRGNLSPE